MLSKLQPSQYVTQIVGKCRKQFLTQYYKHSSANHLTTLLATKLKQYDTLSIRFELCINYVEILTFLHNSPLGTLVMCDTNDLDKTLNQFLVMQNLRLVANDLDALPTVNSSAGIKIKCGHREVFGDFVAPEQNWPFYDREFSDEDMPPYDEKTDIWKIPEVCRYLLGNVSDANALNFRLFKIHNKCKEHNPAHRPDAEEVLNEYKRVWQIFFKANT